MIGAYWFSRDPFQTLLFLNRPVIFKRNRKNESKVSKYCKYRIWERGKQLNQSFFFYSGIFSRFIQSDTARFSMTFRIALGPWYFVSFSKKPANFCCCFFFGLCSCWHAEHVAFFSIVGNDVFLAIFWMTINDIKEKRKEKKSECSFPCSLFIFFVLCMSRHAITHGQSLR